MNPPSRIHINENSIYFAAATQLDRLVSAVAAALDISCHNITVFDSCSQQPTRYSPIHRGLLTLDIADDDIPSHPIVYLPRGAAARTSQVSYCQFVHRICSAAETTALVPRHPHNRHTYCAPTTIQLPAPATVPLMQVQPHKYLPTCL